MKHSGICGMSYESRLRNYIASKNELLRMHPELTSWELQRRIVELARYWGI